MNPLRAVAAPLDGAADSTLHREPLLTPADLGNGNTDGLQYGNPTSNVALVDAPKPTSDGGAHLTYPIVIPKGRGITPDVSLAYDSGAGNSWVGSGWDLSMGDISVDTQWGAPRFDANFESETYAIDGQMLTPNALGDTWAKRLPGDREDYTRQVETDYQQIIRHEVAPGGPKNYYWEVHDKGGNVYWYGGHPDDGGPIGTAGTSTIDRSAIVTDENGNQVSWLLSAQRDVGVNRMDYRYSTVDYKYGAGGWSVVPDCVSSASTLCGKHTFLRDILYTGGAAKSGQPVDPAYEVLFRRASDVHPGELVRKDPVVSAADGYVDVLTDRLARIEVRHGSGRASGDDPRAYDQLVEAYDLGYSEGAFGKSLLHTVGQVGSDGTTSATHTFDYYNHVGTQTAGYSNGFSGGTNWNTGSGDVPDRLLLDTKATQSVLGASESNSAEGHAYVGFNPLIPEKVGSVGGSLQIGGGVTEALSEFLDINGDGLPDKVYRAQQAGDPNDVNRDGPIDFRLNQSRPGGSTTFGDPQTAQGITMLSKEGNFSIEAALEAYPGISIAFGLGTEIAWGDAYFSDVNADGLPDYVSGGKVYFNHLVDGVPHFVADDSSGTPVPILDDPANSPAVPAAVKKLQDEVAAANPLVDTVRRWTAPYGGTVSIDAPVTLAPPAGSTSSDGVRVAIQHNQAQVVAASLLNTGSTAFTSPVTETVQAGDRIYFRVGSVNDGANDQVTWNPAITYTAIDGVADVGTLPTDVNGLSQTTFKAADDFTLSGRPGTQVMMPYQGTVHFSATIDKSITTDKVQVVLLHNGTPVSVSNGTLAAGFAGTRTVSADFPVAAPVVPKDKSQKGSSDSVSAIITAATPIDIHAIDWNPTISYSAATDQDGTAIDLAKRPLTFAMTPEVGQFGLNSPTPQVPDQVSSSRHVQTAHLVFAVNRDSHGAPVVVSVKTRAGIVAQQSVTIPDVSAGIGSVAVDAPIDVDLSGGTDYWFDATVADPTLSTAISLTSFTLKGTPDATVTASYHGAGLQGIFPVPYRGWAVAGYNAADARATTPIDEGDFVIDVAAAKAKYDAAPTGFGDVPSDPPPPDKSFAYLPRVAAPSLPGQATVAGGVWLGNRADMIASANRMSSSRLGADSASLGTYGSGGGRAVTRVSVTGPEAKLGFGVGPLGGSFGVSPSFGLVDYQDMNGDGYPDIITPNHITYTLPRGAHEATPASSGLAQASQNTSLGVSVGLESGLIDIKANAKGMTNANHGSSAAKGGDAESDGGGVGIGVGLNFGWTNPNASGPADSPATSDGTTSPGTTYADQVSTTADGSPIGTTIQTTLSDVNGDGLPDLVSATSTGVFARYNLGYGFAPAAVSLATGGFDTQESYSGGLSLGFATPWADFSGGAALDFDVDLSRYAWVDVNGDGILDQIHKINNTTPPTIRFGTGAGLLPPVTYGTMADSQITGGINAGQQITLDRANGLGVQFDFTIAIGPLCLVACYLIINPGASYQNSVSTSEVDLQDVNGDGYADSVQSLTDGALTVRSNQQGDTNLLSSVHNPLGGTISIGYTRGGNTVDDPKSTWNMSSVSVDDGRPGDGADLRHTTFSYAGGKYDRLHRQSLGYSTVVETELDTATAPETPLRTTTHTFLNDNIFDAGSETDTITTSVATGEYIRGVRQHWTLHAITPGADLAHLSSPASLGYSIAPQLTSVTQEVGNGGMTVGQSRTTRFTYDDLGDIIRQADLGEDDDPNDDVVADYVYTRCATASSLDDRPCVGDVPHGRTSPFYEAGLCGTWVSLPAEITVTNGKSGADRIVYRHRDGRTALCDNASVTHLEESVGDGTTAQTDLTYDSWGSYNRIVYPVGENGRRYAVCYVWDGDGHANIGTVTDFSLKPDEVDAFMAGTDCPDATAPFSRGLTSTATFDPLWGGVASRTDANGNTIRYTYDGLGRIASVSSPVASDPQPLVQYEYHLGAGDSYAVAKHYDFANPGDTIDTATFVDGTGRVVQTKRDAALYQGAGQPAKVSIVASGQVAYDALGRAVAQYNPRESTVPLRTIDNTVVPKTDPHTDTVFDLWDSPDVITDPAGRVTTIAYEYGQVNGSGPQLYRTTETAPSGRKTVTYTDMRDVTRAVDDVPDGAPSQLMTYTNDGMGQLLKTVDSTGATTTNTYDQLGRRTSTTTPDAGLVTFGYDLDGQQTTAVTPNLRAKGQAVTYHYDLHRLTSIDYPGTADDVSYTYGAAGAAGNGAGRIIGQEDGSRILSNAYDAAGNLVRQSATMKLHNWTPSADQSKFTWTTQWAYDGLGRMKSMVYPDATPLTFTAAYNNGVGTGTDPGEKLAYDYDAGGQLRGINGSETGVQTVQVGNNLDGTPILAQLPHTWNYSYLADQQYDEFLHPRQTTFGNQAVTTDTYQPGTQYLARVRTVSPGRNLNGNSTAYQEIQDLNYTYDLAGNPKTYSNDLPATVSNLFGGPSSQAYGYDKYSRLTSATGQWQQAPGKLRHYALALTYDAAGNIASKDQSDQLTINKKDQTQTATTYSFGATHTNAAPHQTTTLGAQALTYDADGNLTLIKSGKTVVRTNVWDAADRLRTVTDGPQTTTYNYDDSGNRRIERGPAGETATLNDWVTIIDGAPLWKHIWAGNNRIGTQRDDGGNNELTKQYFLHKDLQGSTNVVTDANGDTFMHREFFGSGEIWVDEKSTVFRTPYQFAGGYFDEQRGIMNFGARWYDPVRGMFYSPEPDLTADANALVADPALRAAYSYAESNPVGLIDPTGYRPYRPGYSVADDKAIKLRQTAAAALPKGQAAKGAPEGPVLTRRISRQETFEAIDDFAKPFIEINVSTGEIQLSPGIAKQFVVRKGKASSAAAGTTAGTTGTGTAAPSTGTAASSTGAVDANGAGKGAPQRPKLPPKPLPKRPPPQPGV